MMNGSSLVDLGSLIISGSLIILRSLIKIGSLSSGFLLSSESLLSLKSASINVLSRPSSFGCTLSCIFEGPLGNCGCRLTLVL